MRHIRQVLVASVVATAASAQTPVVDPNRVLNSATYAAPGQPGHAVSPGSLVAIFGSELASSLASASSVPLSTQIGDVSVRFGDIPAPLHFVSPNQINAQLPWELLQGAPTGTATVVVRRGNANSAPQTVQLAQHSPGIYSLNAMGFGPGFVLNVEDFSFAQPAGSVGTFAARPARVGSAILIYASGLGPVDPPVANGADSRDAQRRTVTMPVVLIGGVEATVLFSGLAPEFPGVYQLNAAVPQGTPAGDAVPLQVRIGGITTSDRITIAVSN
jgi:uncharacterized protein (TIGR03437 family)